MPGLIIVPKTFAFESSVPLLRNDAVQSAGSLMLLDFSRDDCWNSGVPQNLAADTCLAVTGTAFQPTRLNNGNTRRLNHAFGAGAEYAGLTIPPAFVDYLVGKNIAFSMHHRVINTATVLPWVASTAFNLGTVVKQGLQVYTVTTAGTTGTTAPSHISGAVANGSATLTWGVAASATPSYLTTTGLGGLLWLGNSFPTSYDVVSLSTTAYGQPGGGFGISQHAINHVGASATKGYANGAFSGSGRQITSTQVPSIPGSKVLRFGAELFNGSQLYNAVSGVAPANTAGLHNDLYRLHIEDLAVSGRTVDQFMAAEKAFFETYHPARALLA